MDHHDHGPHRAAIGNVEADDLCHGRQRAILSGREKIKRLTLKRRKEENLSNAA